MGGRGTDCAQAEWGYLHPHARKHTGLPDGKEQRQWAARERPGRFSSLHSYQDIGTVMSRQQTPPLETEANLTEMQERICVWAHVDEHGLRLNPQSFPRAKRDRLDEGLAVVLRPPLWLPAFQEEEAAAGTGAEYSSSDSLPSSSSFSWSLPSVLRRSNPFRL